MMAAILIGASAIAVAAYLRPYAFAGDPGLLRSGSGVRVERGPAGLAFLPENGAKAVGLAFYAGAKVPPEAYAYLARACARAGYPAVLPSFPLGLAVMAPGAAAKAFAAYPEVELWALGGHSLGGAMACSFAAAASVPVAGLFLVAAYPGGGTDLSPLSIPATCLYSAKDGLATPSKVSRARRRMPSGLRFVELAGGNHSQFGEYGPQRGDGVAEITGSAQRAATVDEALALLGLVASAAGK
jgi:hypothetical protein